jgi:hypothetical protein
MTFLEKDLEQIIFESGRDLLEEKGLRIEGKLYRQLRIGNYGIADLVSITKPFYIGRKIDNNLTLIQGEITIYELKKDKIGISALLQALSYARGIQRYLEKRNKTKLFEIKIDLIGKELDTTGSFCFISNLLRSKISFFTYSYDINGIEFKYEYDYSLKNEGF